MLADIGCSRRLLAVLLALVLVTFGCSPDHANAPQDLTGLLPARTDMLPGVPDLYYASGDDLQRSVSSVYSELKTGEQEFATAANSIEDAGDGTQQIIASLTEPGWAIYHFTGLADADTLEQAVVAFVDDFPGTCWVGFADFSDQVWQWRILESPTASTQVDFPAAGHFINPGGVTFIVVAVSGDTAKIASIRVTGETNDAAPVAKLSAAPGYGNNTVDAVLDASATTDRDSGLIVGYEWDFDGDGVFDETGAAATTGHVFTELGYYHPMVRVTDDDGLTDTQITTVEVQGWSRSFGDSTAQIYYGVAGRYTQDYIYATGLTIDAAVEVDVLISKYDRWGKPVWHRTWGGPLRDEGHDIVVDDVGNVYIAGSTASPGTNSSQPYILLLKLNPAGEVVWEKTWSTVARNASAQGIALDPQGNIYLAANAYGFHDNNDFLLLKYNPDGNLVMQKLYATSTQEEARGIALGIDGSIHITGIYGSASAINMAVLKLTSAGAVDAMVGGGGTSWDDVSGITVDLAGNIYITGMFDDLSADSWTTLLVKYDPDLNLEWQRRWLGSDSSWGGAVNCTGGFMSPVKIWVSGHIFDAASPNRGHVLLLQFDSDGNVKMQRAWTSATDKRIYDATFIGNTLYAAGESGFSGGTWGTVTGTAAASSGDFDQIWFGTLEDVTGIQGTYNGEYAELPGTQDTGGGERDGYVMGCFPDKL